MIYTTGEYTVSAEGQPIGKVYIRQDGLLLVFDCTCSSAGNDILRLAAVCGEKYIPLGVLIPEAGALHLKKSFTKNMLASIGYHDTSLFHLIRAGETYTPPEDTLSLLPEDPADTQTASLESAGLASGSNGVDLLEPEPDSSDLLEVKPIDGKAPLPQSAVPLVESIHSSLSTKPEADAQNPILTVRYTEPADPAPQVPDLVVKPAPPAPVCIDGWIEIEQPGLLFKDPELSGICSGISGALFSEQDGILLLAVPISPTEPFSMMPIFCFGSSGQIGGHEYIIFKIKNGNLTI